MPVALSVEAVLEVEVRSSSFPADEPEEPLLLSLARRPMRDAF
jgi:hypothetical protein